MPRSSAAELLAAEARLSRAVKAEIERTLTRERGRSLVTLQAGLAMTLAGLFELGMLGSRRASIEALERELEALRRRGVDVPALATSAQADDTGDRVRAVAAAGAIASGLVVVALEKAQQGKPLRVALRQAANDNRPRVARNVATEVSRAFSEERERVLVHNYRQPAFAGVALVKAWNSTIDRGTCGRCKDLDGTEVRLDEDFPGGVLPGFHAMCRCFIEIRERTERRAA